MKRTKRMPLCIVAALLILTLTFAALAEGKLLSIWNAGSKLLFETDNVSLSAHAAFTYDGAIFKTFDGRYRQDGASSYMQVMLDTPTRNGDITTSGYTVVANNGVSYAIETQRPQYYTQSSASSSPSILTNTAMRAALMRFGGLLLDLMEDRMADAITQTPGDDGTDYRITLSPGQAPEIAGAAMTALLQLYAKEYLYMDHYENASLAGPVDYTYTADYDALFAAEYEKAFDEPLPEDFYSKFYDENGSPTPLLDRYNQICAVIDKMINQAAKAYDTGVAVVENDGSITHYDTYDQYLIAMGRENLRYEDYYDTLRAWYEKETGTALTEEELTAIRSTNNSALYKAFDKMNDAMEAYYRAEARANGYSALLIYPDGTYQGYTDARALNELQMLSSLTVTRRILYTLCDMQVDTADISVKMDQEGRIEKAEGTIAFITTDALGENHTLSIAFTAEAYDYGVSEVKPFDPADYGVVSSQEYYSGDYTVNDVDITPAPETTAAPVTHVTLFGVEYEITTDGNG